MSFKCGWRESPTATRFGLNSHANQMRIPTNHKKQTRNKNKKEIQKEIKTKKIKSKSKINTKINTKINNKNVQQFLFSNDQTQKYILNSVLHHIKSK